EDGGAECRRRMGDKDVTHALRCARIGNGPVQPVGNVEDLFLALRVNVDALHCLLLALRVAPAVSVREKPDRFKMPRGLPSAALPPTTYRFRIGSLLQTY